MEGFGYPAFLTSTGGDLIDAQYDGRLKLGLDGRRPWGRLRPSTFHETMRLQVVLTAPGDV